MASESPVWRPPHCPRASCDSHGNPGTWRFIRKGFYRRRSDGRRVQRYRCTRCSLTFSSQTFSTTYWLKRPDLLVPLFWRIGHCSALRQIAHEFRVVHATVQRLVERLGRHCLLFHERLRPAVPAEPLVLDGFRSFESGQYWPFDLNLLVGVSHFVYGFNDAELRRSGTMRPGQRRRRAALERAHGRPHPDATRIAVQELVGRVVPEGQAAEICSDEHASYPRAFRRLRGRRIRHERTSSRASRTPRNPLFPANLADLLLRHGSANHKRETIAFSKRRQGALYRAAIFTVWRNYVKSSSEARRSAPPGVGLGIVARRLTPAEVLEARLFPWRLRLGKWLERCYFGRIPTRRLARLRTHALSYAV
jgi:transposase-like protein